MMLKHLQRMDDQRAGVLRGCRLVVKKELDQPLKITSCAVLKG
jgi:hypothetical protein